MNKYEIEEEIERTRDDIELMIKYLKLKLREKDFHGVQDAASDIRDMENYILGLKRSLK